MANIFAGTPLQVGTVHCERPATAALANAPGQELPGSPRTAALGAQLGAGVEGALPTSAQDCTEDSEAVQVSLRDLLAGRLYDWSKVDKRQLYKTVVCARNAPLPSNRCPYLPQQVAWKLVCSVCGLAGGVRGVRGMGPAVPSAQRRHD